MYLEGIFLLILLIFTITYAVKKKKCYLCKKKFVSREVLFFKGRHYCDGCYDRVK